MLINIHATVSKNSLPYFDYMIKNYSQLLSEENQIKFHAYCLDFSSYESLKGNFTSHFIGEHRGTLGHCEAAKTALAQIKKNTLDSINIIADTDTVMLVKNWDIAVCKVLENFNVMGSSYERYGGFSSGDGMVQTYKNKPNLTWFAMGKNVDLSVIDLTPNKGSHYHIQSELDSKIYELPIGFFVLRDTGWQIPKFLVENNVSYKTLTHEKPTKNAKVVKTGHDYHEEYQLDGLPLVAHQRGSMSKEFMKSELSVQFYSVIDAHLRNL
jgi:hypothetical protein